MHRFFNINSNPNIKTLSDLTPEAEAKIPDYISRDLEDVAKGKYYDNYDKEATYEAIKRIYKKCGLKPPKLYVAENPFEMNLLFNYLGLFEEIENKTEDYDKLLEQKLNYGPLELYPIIEKDLDERLKLLLVDWLSLRHKDFNRQIDDLLETQFEERRRLNYYLVNFRELDELFFKHFDINGRFKLGPVADFEGMENIFKLNTSGLRSLYAFTYESMPKFEFIEKELGPGRNFKSQRMTMYELLRKAGIFSAICAKEYCVMTKFPKKVHWDEAYQLHNPKGPAIEWGYTTELTKWDACYYIEGRQMPESIFNGFTRMDFITMEDEDIRAGMYAIIESDGEGSMLKFLEAKKVHEQQFVHANGEIETMELYKTVETYKNEEDLNGNSPAPLAWLKIICPSTGAVYLLPSDSAFNTCADAAKYHRPDFVAKDVPYTWEQRS